MEYKFRKVSVIFLGFYAFLISFGFLIQNTSAQMADSPWPMFHGDVRHTGLSKYNTSQVDGTVKWTFEAGGGIESSPAIGVDGTIYFGAHDNKFYAVNPDGTLKWKFDAGEPVYSEEWNVWKGILASPAINQDGTIYFVSMSNNFFALNPDGTEKWRYPVHVFVNLWTSPAIGPDGTIYIGSESYPPGKEVKQEFGGRLYALNPDGTLKWRYDTDSAGFGNPPAIGKDGIIYTAGGDWDEGKKNFASAIFAFNPDGSVKWKFKPDAVVEGSPTIADDGTIYVGTKNGKFYALNPEGDQRWIFQTGGGISALAALGKDKTIYIGSWDGNFYALNPEGKELWRFDIKKDRDPKIFESYPGKEAISASAAISAEGTIYFGDVIDTFYALDSNGKEKWRYTDKSGGHSASPAIAQDGTVYAATYGNILAFGEPRTETNSKRVEVEARTGAGSKKFSLVIYLAGSAIILIISVVAYTFIRKKNKI